jgi:ABC-type antimicrobial peptide transport system permease subunit
MSISSERVLGLLSFLFGGLATLVASAGLYGVIAYAAVRRTREIGVRLAIGARRSDIIRLFVGEALALAALGIAIGTPAALGCARLFQTLLYGLDAGDPVTLAAAATTLLAVAWLAALLPARRAARLNPMVALRYE